jgi:hypothetical protein
MGSSAHHAHQFREEVVMVAIALITAHREFCELLKNVIARCREMVDALVSDRMRRAAAEAEYVRKR